MELDSAPEDWERHNHGSNSAFDGVILHLACTPSRKEWFTRNSRHERIPLAVIPASMLNGTEALPAAAPDRSCRPCGGSGNDACRTVGNPAAIRGGLPLPAQAPPAHATGRTGSALAAFIRKPGRRRWATTPIKTPCVTWRSGRPCMRSGLSRSPALRHRGLPGSRSFRFLHAGSHSPS